MLPVIALIGRPNVGKSTLFNCLTHSRDALVANYSGLTRDRKYGEGKLSDYHYIVIDTGGIVGDEVAIDSKVAEQSFSAVKEADIILFVVDAQQGLTDADSRIASYLRKQSKSVWIVLNKIDAVNPDIAAAEFYGLGMGDPQPVAAAHRRGISSLINHVMETAQIPQTSADNEQQNSESDEDELEHSIKIAIIGRPNVGKSTLVNRMLGEERVVVYDQAGTTRDSIYIPYERENQKYTLIDTAGVRRKGKVTEIFEKFSVIKTLKAIKDADVTILVLDAREGIVDQDLHMLSYAIEAGSSIVIAMNKWDRMSPDDRQKAKNDIDRRLVFINFVTVHFISAMHGSGVGNLYKSINEAWTSKTRRWSSGHLTRILEEAVKDHQPPLIRKRRIKLRYCHMGGNNPPTFVIHGNQTSEIPRAYSRYLENKYRSVLNITGSPIRIEFKTGENPFAGKKNELTASQLKKRQRMIQHVKQAKKKRKHKM
ncbi:MAG: ribosome biogenesis GTPase Der [Endozoicomonadaceae bacterium]|nr:ribosome biogenesis GTPase Der [Endozoicomonadaceae bacterium]